MAARFYDSPRAQALRQLVNPLLIFTFVLSLGSIFLQQAGDGGRAVQIIILIIDSILALLISLELTLDLLLAPYPFLWMRRNWLSLILSLTFLLLYLANISGLNRVIEQLGGGGNIAAILVLRNFFLAFKVFSRIRRISLFIGNLTVHPAQTLALSFLMVILAGTLYLMLPFTTRDGEGLRFIDALFTTTSAVCVTGLIVVDTATHFTIAGQLGILVLIQIGGLGIMILSFSAAWVLRRKFSLQDKLLISYMTNEDDLTQVSRALIRIVGLTFAIEALGAFWLFFSFFSRGFGMLRSLWYGVFHSVSAFCNAGFALFSDSFESYAGDVSLNLAISFLIIAGGLSFAVMTDLISTGGARLKRRVTGHRRGRSAAGSGRLQLNTRIVVITSAVLILGGMLFIYGSEYRASLAHLPLGRQYLAAFFQSVTLRTAGFNTVPFGLFSNAAVLMSMALMFVGGASGSTAGGIKVNTLAVLIAYLRSRLKGDRKVRMFEFVLGRDTSSNAIMLFIFGCVTVVAGMLLLSLSEQAEFTDIAFETVSAFATVGVSRGLTPMLSDAGRIIISLLMFIGRLGPLTLLSAMAYQTEEEGIYYPETDVLIG